MKRTRKKAAARSDIIGKNLKKATGKWKVQYERLSKLRDQFNSSREGLSRDVREGKPNYSMHTADAGTDSYDRDWALSMLSQEQNALYEIEQAMNRIRNKTYGICELTGEPISRARLVALPWTRFCAKAERELEEEGKIQRTQLGERRTVIEPELAETENG